MSSGKTCPRCGCTEIDKDSATGGAYCTNCGSVLEENAIVAEVEFFETGSGGHGALGQFVSADAPSKLHIGSVPGVSVRESREVTLQRAKRLIQEVAGQLGGLNQHCKETALNFFSMAVRGGLTRGRRSTHVIAACLYITCRLEGTPHLLLDFSDVLQVNIYELGKVYSFLARKLLIRLPQIDPCDYIMRFAHCLNFGDKERDVAMVALRLVQRMKRDWMAYGRRPTGLCGAALLLAARYHNFNRTVNDVIQVVNISESVVRKRLEEFACTPSSELTLDEFQTVDLEQTCDPPSFQEARNKAKKEQAKLQSQTDVDLSSKSFKALEKELPAAKAAFDAALTEASPARRNPLAKLAKMDDEGRTGSSLSFLDRSGDAEMDQEPIRQFVEGEILSDIMSDSGRASTSAAGTEFQTPAERYRTLRPTLETLGLSKSAADSAATTSTAETGTNEEDDTILTSDIDDDEIDSYLLNSDEVKIKQELWMAHYEDFMVALEEKRRIKEEERQKEEQEGGPKKKKAAPRKKKPIQPAEIAATASEAIEKMVQEKKLSNKINYDVLKSLIVETPQESEETPISSESTPAPSNAVPESTSSSFNRFKPYPLKKPPISETPTTSSSTASGMERRFRIGARIASTFNQRRPKAEDQTQDSNVTSVDIS